MKLYFSPGACSLSPHIVVLESQLTCDLVKVDLRKKLTSDGQNYLEINPKGYVPALQLDNGDVLTEGPAIVQYIADQVPNNPIIPKAGTFQRYKLQEWLNFISTEPHKYMGAMFKADLDADAKKVMQGILSKRFDYLEKHLAKNKYLMGDQFTVADAYLFTILRWTHFLKIDMKTWPAIMNYMEIINQRPAVQAALKAEEMA